MCAAICGEWNINPVSYTHLIDGIPFELEEAAMVDGCSRFKGVVKIVLPMLVPGIITVAAFAFIACWNEFLFSLMFLNCLLYTSRCV